MILMKALFPSRNRGSFDFKDRQAQIASARNLRFRSRNQGSFDFK